MRLDHLPAELAEQQVRESVTYDKLIVRESDGVQMYKIPKPFYYLSQMKPHTRDPTMSGRYM